MSITASLGVAFAGSDAAEHLLRNADLAMARAKEAGGGRVEVFDNELRATVEHRRNTEDELRVGIADGQLRVLYQPVLSVETRQPVGFEALVRFRFQTLLQFGKRCIRVVNPRKIR